MPDMPSGRPEERDADEAKNEGKGVAGTAAAGLGCLSVATLPFSVILLLILAFLAIWLVKNCGGQA